MTNRLSFLAGNVIDIQVRSRWHPTQSPPDKYPREFHAPDKVVEVVRHRQWGNIGGGQFLTQQDDEPFKSIAAKASFVFWDTSMDL